MFGRIQRNLKVCSKSVFKEPEKNQRAHIKQLAMDAKSTRIGQMTEKLAEIEWKIPGFFSYNKVDQRYESPKFGSQDFSRYLVIYPCGQTSCKSYGWIGLFMFGYDRTEQQTRTQCTLSITTVDGKVQKTRMYCNVNEEGCGHDRFLRRLDLVQRGYDILPVDLLTVTCVISEDEGYFSLSDLNLMSKNMTDMFLKKKDCDVAITVGGRVFTAHKFILVARCPVFATMFESDEVENDTPAIKINNCCPKAFNEFLLYLYSGKFRITKENSLELYKISDIYDVHEMKSTCLDFLYHSLSKESVCDMFIFGDLFNLPSLTNHAQNYFNKNFSDIVTSESWELLLRENYQAANKLLKNYSSKPGVSPRVKER